MADVNRGNRPLSPHLSVYRWSWTMATSILTRITGNALIVSAALVAWWFAALAAGGPAFGLAHSVITSWFGMAVMVISLLGLWYHLLAGLRHLIWDQVVWIDVPQANLFSKVIVGGAVALTVLTVLILGAF